ncbi:MAG: hypothetical protein P1U32_09385, partial [Legionellaceae bacterium]|nr:hypothetical protein [Legionellaceae bacterium]
WLEKEWQKTLNTSLPVMEQHYERTADTYRQFQQAINGIVSCFRALKESMGLSTPSTKDYLEVKGTTRSYTEALKQIRFTDDDDSQKTSDDDSETFGV